MAESLFRRSLVIREKLFQHRAELAWDLAGLGKSLEGEGNYAEAEKLYVRCLKIYFPDAGGLYFRLRSLGRCYLAQGRKKEARAFLKRATQLERESRDIFRAVAIGNLANRKCGLKKYQESEALFKRAWFFNDIFQPLTRLPLLARQTAFWGFDRNVATSNRMGIKQHRLLVG